MNALDHLHDMSRDMLIDIIHTLGRNWVTVDGLWFQIIEREFTRKCGRSSRWQRQEG